MNFHIDPNSVADAGDEYGIQVRLRQRMKMLAPKVRLVATPNGMKTTAWAANRAKSEGMSKGFCDLTALWSNGEGVNAVPGVAFLELKKRGGSIDPAQTDWLNWLTNAGFACGVFKSVDTAVDFLRRQGAPFLFQQEAA